MTKTTVGYSPFNTFKPPQYSISFCSLICSSSVIRICVDVCCIYFEIDLTMPFINVLDIKVFFEQEAT